MTRFFGLDSQLLFEAPLVGIAVFILFIALSYLLFNPVRKVLEDRAERIRKDIDSAKEEKEDAISFKTEYDEKLKNINKEAELILSDARKAALKNESKIINEAKQEAARIIERANEEALLEKKRALDEIKQEMIAVASLMAGKVVAASIDTTIQDSLVEETLKEMGEQTWLS